MVSPGWTTCTQLPRLARAMDSYSDDHVRLNSVGRGQEFVIDGDHYPELEDWVSSIILNHS